LLFSTQEGTKVVVRKKQRLKGREFAKLLPEKDGKRVRAAVKLLHENDRKKILAADLSKEPIRIAYSSPETTQEIAKLSPEDLKRILETDLSKGPVKAELKR